MVAHALEEWIAFDNNFCRSRTGYKMNGEAYIELDRVCEIREKEG